MGCSRSTGKDFIERLPLQLVNDISRQACVVYDNQIQVESRISFQPFLKKGCYIRQHKGCRCWENLCYFHLKDNY